MAYLTRYQERMMQLRDEDEPDAAPHPPRDLERELRNSELMRRHFSMVHMLAQDFIDRCDREEAARHRATNTFAMRMLLLYVAAALAVGWWYRL